MWNPNTCECQCDKWCKTGQYLDHKNCVCKNKLIGRLIEECTNVMINNNKDNIINNNNNNNNNTYLILFIIILIGFIVFLIGFIYYCRRSNFNKKKIKRFHLSKSKNFDLLNYKNGYKAIRNKKQN